MKRNEITPPLKWILLGWLSEALVRSCIKIQSWYCKLLIKILKKTHGAHEYTKKQEEKDHEKLFRDLVRELDNKK